MKKTITKISVLGVVLLPLLTFAQKKDLEYVINDIIIKYFNYAVYLIIALAVVMFVWNVYKYFIAGGDDVGAKKEAGQYVLWSVVGFFVILSIWGLVNILMNSFNLDNNEPRGFFPSFGKTRSNKPFDGTGTTGGFDGTGTTGGNNAPNVINNSVKFDAVDSNLR